MSRSAFSEKFTRVVGVPPIKCLLEERMRRACKLLRQGRHSLKEIAVLVGYGSEAAFSTAFKRWGHMAPGVYRTTRMTKDGASPD